MWKYIIPLCILLSAGGCSSYKGPSLDTSFPTHHVSTWLDTDLACDTDLIYADPDDCLAYILAKRAGMQFSGVSTIFGNASELSVWDVAQRVVTNDPLYRGGGDCNSDAIRLMSSMPHVTALGPLTNIAKVISCFPKTEMREIIFIGGKKERQEFIPNPAWPLQLNLADLNVEKDIQAVRTVLRAHIPLTLLPFEAGNAVPIKTQELRHNNVVLPDYLEQRLEEWERMFSLLAGTNGFLPFDPVAIAYLLWPQEFFCEQVTLVVEGKQLIARPHKEGIHTYCTPKNPDRVRQLIISQLAK